MPRGTIKRIGTERGFGFITPDGYGPALFFHATAVVGTVFEQLRPGQRVEFDQSRDPWSGRQRAVNVRPTKRQT